MTFEGAAILKLLIMKFDKYVGLDNNVHIEKKILIKNQTCFVKSILLFQKPASQIVDKNNGNEYKKSSVECTYVSHFQCNYTIDR